MRFNYQSKHSTLPIDLFELLHQLNLHNQEKIDKQQVEINKQQEKLKKQQEKLKKQQEKLKKQQEQIDKQQKQIDQLLLDFYQGQQHATL